MIKILFIDVDGTLTDGKINIGPRGEIYKSFNVKDGLGLKKLMSKKITPVIITGRKSKIVEIRCNELGLNELYQDVSNKKNLIQKILKERNITPSEAAYIGDDENDLDSIKICGLSFSPNDAIEVVKKNVDVILNLKGGEGCVREAIEYILKL